MVFSIEALAGVGPQAVIGPTSKVPPAASKSAGEPPVLGGPSSSDQTPPYQLRIGSGDLLEVSVYGFPDMTQQQRVSGSGDVSLPLIGTVHVAGLTVQDAQTVLNKRYGDGKYLLDANVSVFIKEYSTQGISVLGEVTHPGIYPMLGAHKLLDAISVAGGTTPKAGRDITITRRDKPRSPISVELSNDPSKVAALNVDVLPGDTIVVSKVGVIYVVGEVRNPSGIAMDNNNNLTVLQAIAMAQGTTPVAALNQAKVIRRGSAGIEEIPVPLNKILQSKAPDIHLQAEDILFVPVSAGRSVGRRTLESVIQMATGLAIYRR